jgi:DNA replication regulator DPB11
MADHSGKDLLPLSNVVLCSTSLPQDVRVGPSTPTKPHVDAYLQAEQIRLADTAQQMGATHKLDLTGEVTHLIVGDLDTPKYKYVAKERPDIVVLDPKWIDAVREVWMDGGEVDVEGLEKKHRYPTLAGLKICITGITDQARRNELSSTVEHEGAEYHGDLTKQVTHLLVAAPEGAKYKAAKDWRIHTVSLKWLEDSVQRGMALDPRYYDPTMSYEEQGKGAYRKESGPRTTLGKRVRTEERPSAGNENGKRKLRRHASRRLEDHSQDVWQDISAVDISTTVAAPSETDQWTVGEEDSQLSLGRPGPRPQVRKSFNAQEVRTAEEPDSRLQGVFSGWRVTMQGFAKDKAERLVQYLEPNGAHVIQRLQDLEAPEADEYPWKLCLIVPHAQPSPDMHIDPAPSGVVTATEWWVERCLLYKQALDPEIDVLSQPLWNLNILGFSKLTVSTTGFSGVDYRQVAEAVKLSGATYQEQLNSTISILVSGSSTVKKEKAYYAAKHHIPVVTADWLWTCLKTKRKTSTDRYKIELPKFDPNDIGRASMASPALSDALSRSNSMNTKTAKDNQTLSRLSNTRKRQTAPSLPLQARKQSPAAKAPPPAGPFVHEDEDDDEDDDPGYQANGDDNLSVDPAPEKAVPLQDISINSPRKPSSAEPFAKTSTEHLHSLDGPPEVEKNFQDNPPEADSAAQETSSHTKNESPAPLPTSQPPLRPQAEWTADLASLMEKQHQRRPSSEHDKNPAQRLKHRKLGRAISGSSLGNRANDAQQLHRHDTNGSKENSFSESPEDPSAAAAAAAASHEADLPSTQIGYETLETEAARKSMAKLMGKEYSDESVGTRLASLGTVRDSGAGSGGAGGGGRSRTTRPRN